MSEKTGIVWPDLVDLTVRKLGTLVMVRIMKLQKFYLKIACAEKLFLPIVRHGGGNVF